MAKNYSKRNRTRKSLIAMLCALSVTCTGLAAACAPTDDNDEDNSITAREDAQLLKNGNFEHFDIPDKAVHLIKNVNNWSLGGDTSVKSGVINVASGAWDDLTDEGLAAKLDYNNDLSSSDDDYVNYNSMRSRDLLYKDNYAATLDKDDVEDSWIKNQGYEKYFGIEPDGDKYFIGTTEVYKNADDGEYYLDKEFKTSVRKQQITNPGTHYNLDEKNNKVTVGDKTYDVKKDDKTGSLYYTDDDKNDIYISNVLMVHNSPTDTKFNGVNQYYTSSTITLEANTSAEISFWVKTSDLKFDKGYSALEDEDKGAYVEVVQSVAGTTIDNFAIKAINTQKIINNAAANALEGVESNGWLQYTVYVNACDFSSSTVQLKLGLGGSENNEKVTGYAFFDDVQVTKYRSLDKIDGYSADKVADTKCNLTSEAEDKLFYADAQTRGGSDDKHRTPYDFHYLIDLASEQGDDADKTYKSLTFGNNVEAWLTTEKDSKGKIYAASDKLEGTVSGVKTKTANTPEFVKDAKALPTGNDLIGAFEISDTAFKTSDFKGTDYSAELNKAVEGLDKTQGGNMLALFSAWGVPYTATVSDTAFTVSKDSYKIVSFWVKTSDMDGGTAATLKIYEEKLDESGDVVKDENGNPLAVTESVQTITIDTTGNKVNFENEKDIYNGWVQCFFFVKNDTDADKSFKIDFGFGTTSIISASGSYDCGWAIIANMQTLNIDKDIYDLASSGNTCALFSFYDEEEDTKGNAFDEPNSIYDVEKEISVPSNYTGKNGVGSFDAIDKHTLTGLINRDHAESYTVWSDIATSFATANATWNEAFGKGCYQPLIIINTLRQYAELAEADETTFNSGNYYVEAEDGYTGTVVTVGGKNYRLVSSDDKYSKDTNYYKLQNVVNYGYIGENKSVSANNTETISVKVKVVGDEGASAWIYLIDTSDTNKALSYTTPTYTFYYDEEGNVLKEKFSEDWKDDEHRSNIVYTLRDDGLYTGKDGKVYANLHNLIRSYKDTQYEHNKFYDKDGKPVSFDDLKDGEKYYKSETVSDENIADHYLCTSDGTNVYEYKDGKYYYLVKNEKTEMMEASVEVNNFDESIAIKDYPAINKELAVEVTAEDCATLGENGWVTVNFVIQTGSEAKDYRLELWNGSRNEKGVAEDGSSFTKSAVAFDLSQYTVSDAEKSLEKYENEILNAYYKLVAEQTNASELFDKIETENITAYEKLLEEEKIANTVKDKYNYVAQYYSYTLYDSEAYIPFNADTASEGETGYNYDSSLFGERLAYFTVDDDEFNSKNVFVDYTTVDQDIKPATATDDGDDDEDDDNTDSTELGLYISSIVLVAVLLVTLASIGITQFIKNKRKRNGAKASKNYRKKERYIKKLHLVKNEEVVEDTEPVEAPTDNDKE